MRRFSELGEGRFIFWGVCGGGGFETNVYLYSLLWRFDYLFFFFLTWSLHMGLWHQFFLRIGAWFWASDV